MEPCRYRADAEHRTELMEPEPSLLARDDAPAEPLSQPREDAPPLQRSGDAPGIEEILVVILVDDEEPPRA
jgi:hypothetical protein